MGLHDYGIYQVIERNATLLRRRVALIDGNRAVTHEQLLREVDRVAAGLGAAGARKGDRVAVLALNGLEYVYLYGAAAKMGAIVLPLNWRLSQAELEHILTDASPRIMLTGADFEGIAAPLRAKMPFIEQAAAMDLAALTGSGGATVESEAAADDPFVIMYTAAVSGQPRGAVLSQRAFIASNLQLMHGWRAGVEDCHLCALPLFHFGALSTTLALIQAGGVSVMVPRFDADAALRHIRDHRVTILVEFPPMLGTLLDRAKETGSDLGSLRIVMGIDQPDTIRRLEEETRAVFWVCYGQTECGVVTLSPFAERPGSAGRPGLVSEVRISDDAGDSLGPGQAGEIVVRGPTVFEGYWARAEDSAYTFRRGWHHTGDLGCFDADGYLWYTGRKPEKALIKPGGENVYPAEVEQALLAHPLVADAVVIGVPDPQWGEAVKAICVLRAEGAITEAELIEFVGGRIARYKKPRHVAFVPRLPRGQDGAVDLAAVNAEHGRG